MRTPIQLLTFDIKGVVVSHSKHYVKASLTMRFSLVLLLGLVCILMAAQQVNCADDTTSSPSTSDSSSDDTSAEDSSSDDSSSDASASDDSSTEDSSSTEATTASSGLTEEEQLKVQEILRRLAAERRRGNTVFRPHIGVVVRPGRLLGTRIGVRSFVREKSA